jgi:adenosylhomocysteine nucleosidase
LYAIVTALREELSLYLKTGGFRRSTQSNGVGIYESPSRPDVVVLEGGVGKENAERATRYALDRYRPEFIISAGFAGAVAPGLDAGRLFLCDRLVAMDGPPALWSEADSHPIRNVDEGLVEVLAGNAERAGRSVDYSGCMTVSTFISGAGLKSWIGRNFQVQVVDMESYWVCGVASERGVPAAVVRSVLDSAEQDLPYFVSCEARDRSPNRWARALRHLASRPQDAPGLFRLRSQAKVANESISTFLEALHDGR